jgi:hypothetical protein
VERFPGSGRHGENVVLGPLRRYVQTVEVEITSVGAGHHHAFLFGNGREPVNVCDVNVLSRANTNHRWHIAAFKTELRFAGSRISDGIESERAVYLRKVRQGDVLSRGGWRRCGYDTETD